jgi:cellulose synthase/poly-beta-1,6-N-acetylglucosamine synthase-like glycosyltransferase
MAFIVVWWLLFGFLALGPAAFIFFYMKKSSKKPWPTKVVSNYQPRISILVPTYNESSTILLKLINLSRLKYPINLMEIIIVDSNSSDGTGEIIRQFCEKQPPANIKILFEKERKGKSQALNYALGYCNGEVIIVSDADCFWPSDILEKSIPFLADPTVGAVGGPKVLLNANQNWITRMEEGYLKSANSLRLGESKVGSTVFFEGGFSAFKRAAVDKFDPHRTGSDDCGTALRTIENGYRAMLVPEAKFYSTFPITFRNKINLKLRRINQLIRVFGKYLNLLVDGKLKSSKITVVPNVLLYLFSPVAFVVFLVLTGFVTYTFPYFLLLMLLLLVPKFRFYFYQILENNLLLIAGIFGVMVGRRFSIWSQPEDRALLNEDTLNRFNLI